MMKALSFHSTSVINLLEEALIRSNNDGFNNLDHIKAPSPLKGERVEIQKQRLEQNHFEL